MTADLHRVRVRVPPAFIETVRRSGGTEVGQQKLLSTIEDKVESVGFDETLLVTEDPTEASIFSLLTRRSSDPIKPDPSLQFLSVEPVDEPPSSQAKPPPNPQALDSGLSPDEILMVRQVLLEDTNPRHLNGVAYCFEPFFPVSASLLRTKADLLDIRKTPEAKSDQALDEHVRTKMRELWDRSRLAPSRPTSNDPRFIDARRKLAALSTRSGTPLKVLHDEVRRAACLMVEEDPDELPKLKRFPREVVEAAGLCLSDLADLRTQAWRRHLRIVDPSRLNAVIPPDPVKDGFVSPSAIQLALSTSKPASSGVLRPIKSPVLYDQLLHATNTARGMRARAQMERANRVLERRRWVDWWQRLNTIRNSTYQP